MCCDYLVDMWGSSGKTMYSSWTDVVLCYDMSFKVLLWNESSSLELSSLQKMYLVSSIHCCKDNHALRWKPPHRLCKAQLVHTFTTLIYSNEHGTLVGMHGAMEETPVAWTFAFI